MDGYYSYYGDGYTVSGEWDGSHMGPGAVEIFAFWSYEADRSTITFNGNGATNVPQYTQVVDGSGYYYTALVKNAYTREGYRFIGWSTKEDGTGDWYNDCDVPVTEWEKETTLYAQWEKSIEHLDRRKAKQLRQLPLGMLIVPNQKTAAQTAKVWAVCVPRSE